MSMNYFVSSIGGYVLRGSNPIYVKDYEMAMALFRLQDENYKFSPMITVSSNVCTSCEA